MTEDERRRQKMVNIINPAVAAMPDPRKELEAKHGQVWDTKELQKDYEVLGFGAPFVVVKRRVDSVKGSLMFSHRPRFYFSFTEA